MEDRILTKAYIERESKKKIATRNFYQKIEKLIKLGDEESIALAQKLMEDRRNSIQNETKVIKECWDFSNEKKREELISNSELILRPLKQEDYDSYIQVKKEQSRLNESQYDSKDFCDYVWSEVKEPQLFYCAIVKKEDDMFIGYCGVNDTGNEVWEIVIELLNAYQSKGYGYKGLVLCLNAIREITGRNQFSAVVEVDNIACQGLMKKMGAELAGIKEWVFHDAADKIEFEEKYINEITESMRELAKELDIHPRLLLSHVLEYRLTIK